MKLAACLVLASFAFAPAALATDEHDSRAVFGVAKIAGCMDRGVSGKALLRERPSTEGVKLVDIVMLVKGLPDGKHAVHIHEVGACEPCSAAGGHFDPGPASSPAPDGNHPFHSGDLINIDVKNGRGVLRTTTSRVALSPGKLSIFDSDGSAFIIHVDPDTYCPTEDPSLPGTAGCAGGARAACGVIEPAPNRDDEWLD
jgi:Cu-Zn family superoxide dismutase